MVGQSLSRYQIVERLGKGGMGVVYGAYDPVLGRSVALKLCSQATDPAAKKRLADEARAASTLNHPNIAQIFDFFETEEGIACVVMEWVRGRTLRDVLQDGPLPSEEVRNVAVSIARALEQAHDKGIIHRDIKPANIQITDTGEVKVLDFGVAQIIPESVEGATQETTRTQSFTSAGTPSYMSPEQARGHTVDRRSDLYSLGCVLFECLTGRRAIQGENMADVLVATLTEVPPKPSELRPEVPTFWDHVCAKLLAKDPSQRYSSASELRKELGLDDTVRLPERKADVAAPLNRKMILGGVAALLLVVAAAAWFFSNRPTSEAKPEAVRWFREGVRALQDGSYRKASKALERSVSIDPNYSLAHARLAESWLELDYVARAKDALLRAEGPDFSTRPMPDADRQQISAIHFAIQGDHESAVRAFQKLLESSKNDDREAASLDLGRAYERNEDLESAIAEYRSILRGNPDSAAAWVRIGNLLTRQKKYPEAEEALRKAESLYDVASNAEGVAEARYGLGLLYKNRGDLNEAKSQFQKTADSANVTGNVQQQIKVLLQFADLSLKQNDTEQGKQYAEKALQMARDEGIENLTTRGLIDLANALQLSMDYPTARRYYEQAIDASRRNGAPRNEARALVNYGGLLVHLGENERGIQALDKARAFYEQGGYRTQGLAAGLLLARARKGFGELKAAEQELTRLQPLAKEKAEQALVAEEFANLLLLRERYREAINRYQQAGALHEQASRPVGKGYALLGEFEATLALGDLAGARTLLGKAQELARREKIARLASEAEVRGAQLSAAEGRYGQAATLLAAQKAASTNALLTLAESRSGKAEAAKSACSTRIADAEKSRSAIDLNDTLLACTEAASTARDNASLTTWSTRAASDAERLDRPVTRWQALAYACRATLADNHCADARSAWSQLEEVFNPQDLQSFSKRQDVRLLLASTQPRKTK